MENYSDIEQMLAKDVATWEKTVDKFIAGELDPRKPVTMLNSTPLVLSLLGADVTLPVITDYSKLKKILNDKHRLPADVLKQVPSAMTDPIMIFDSATMKGDFVMMLDLKDEVGATVVVPVSLNFEKRIIGKKPIYTVNYVSSVYTKKHEDSNTPNDAWFKSQIETGNLCYINHKKNRQWMTSSRLQLPWGGSFTSGKNKIYTEADLVKLKEIAPALYRGSTPEEQATQPASAIHEISLGILRGSVKPSRIEEQVLYQSAYHGTRHKFEQFSLHAVGTGEGAQSHGWGLYFAQNQEIAEEYRKSLAINKVRYVLGGKEYTVDDTDPLGDRWFDAEGNSLEEFEPVTYALSMYSDHGKNIESAIEEIQETIEFFIEEYNEEPTVEMAALALLEGGIKKIIPGQLYEVEIPDSKLMLDEEKMFAKQPAKVKKALYTLVSNMTDEQLAGAWYNAPNVSREEAVGHILRELSQTNGWGVYDKLSLAFGSPKAASLALNAQGVKGITYDGQKDGRCFVVFDDNAIEVLQTFYQFAGEKGAARLDQAEEASKRMDDLKAAKEMEAAGKPEAFIKLATGWERGADNKWRYELDDSYSEASILYPDHQGPLADQLLSETQRAELERKLEVALRLVENPDAPLNTLWVGDELAEATKIAFSIGNPRLFAKQTEALLTGNILTLGAVYENDELFTAYPNLASIPVIYGSMGGHEGRRGGFDGNSITLERKNNQTPEKLKSTLVHEIQHVIQQQEGFASGGTDEAHFTIGYVEDLYNAAQAEAREVMLAKFAYERTKEFSEYIRTSFVDPDHLQKFEKLNATKEAQIFNPLWDAFHNKYKVFNAQDFGEVVAEGRYIPKDSYHTISQALDRIKKRGSTYGFYKSLMGEVEARNVQTRISMSVEERLISLATETEDVSRRDQIFLRQGIEMLCLASDKETLTADQKLAKDVAAWGDLVDGMQQKPREPQLMLTQTPLIMHLLGAEFREVYAAPHVFDGMIHSRTGKVELTASQNLHPNMTSAILKQIPAAMTDPIAVFASATNLGRLVFMLDLKDENGATIVVPVQLDGQKGRKQALIHIATSAYSKERRGIPDTKWFERQTKNLLYVNLKKETQFATAAGSNSLWKRATALLEKRILTDADFVKLKEQYENYYARRDMSVMGSYRQFSDPENFSKGVITFFESADISTAGHEIGHWLRQVLETSAILQAGHGSALNDWKAACDFVGADLRQPWSREQEEMFADAFVSYLKDGHAPNQYLAHAFAALKTWLTNLYARLTGREEVNISPELANVFNNLLSPQQRELTPSQYKDEIKESILKATEKGKSPYSEAQADAYAEIIDCTLQTFAERTGVSFEQVYASLSPTLEAAQTEELIVPEQRSVEVVEKQFKGTEQWMKAPNGKPTNLDEAQWLLVRTPEFKAWFGDWERDPKNASKALDENGEPKVVWHGSPNSGFSVFDTQGQGKTDGTGAWFAGRKNTAQTYSGTRDELVVFDDDGELTADSGRYNYPVFLNIRNPYVWDAEGRNWDHVGEVSIYDNEAEEWFYEDSNGRAFNTEDEAWDYIENELEDPDHERFEAHQSDETTDDIVREVRSGWMSDNYDGVIFMNVQDSGPHGDSYPDTEYIVFEPEQIKSAVRNIGLFSKNNPNIFHQSFKQGEQSMSETQSDTQQVQAETKNDGEKKKGNLYQTFSEKIATKIIEKLQQGQIPWRKDWKDNIPVLPYNPTTNKPYRGGNIFALMLEERSDPRWLTYKQAEAIGAQVRKGEKAADIVYWKTHDYIPKVDENGEPELDENGKQKKVLCLLERPILCPAKVFNAEQIDGMPPLTQEAPTLQWEPFEIAEEVMHKSGAEIRYGGNRAFYRPAEDKVYLPQRAQFAEQAGFYATALHELGHWTGHESRLNRDIANMFGSPDYAREELRAELAAAVMCMELGVPNMQLDNNAAYMQHWIKKLEDDPREILRAASDAEKIRKFLVEPVLEKYRTPELAQAAETEQIEEKLELHYFVPEHLGLEKEEVFTFQALSSDEERKQAAAYMFEESMLAEGVEPEQLTMEELAEVATAHDLMFTAAGVGFQKSECVIEEVKVQAVKSAQEEDLSKRQYLTVPYEEKAQAKKLGAKWDKQKRSWYAANDIVAEKCAKWLKTNVEKEEIRKEDQATKQVFDNALADAERKAEALKRETEGRIYLTVPYREKNSAKSLGAKWDKQEKTWYAEHTPENKEEICAKFERWLPENQVAQDPAISPSEELEELLKEKGAIIPVGGVTMDGQVHVLKTSEEGKSVSYMATLDSPLPSGNVLDKQGQIEKWTYKAVPTPAESSQTIQQEKEKRREEIRKAIRAREVRNTAAAQARLERLPKAMGTQPYLVKNGICPHEGMCDENGKLVVKLEDVHKRSMLTVDLVNSVLKYANGSDGKGKFYNVDGEDLSKAKVIIAANSVADACMIKEVTGYTAVAAINLGNMPTVAKKLHEKYPDTPIVVAAPDINFIMGQEAGNILMRSIKNIENVSVITPVFGLHNHDFDKQRHHRLTHWSELSQTRFGKEGIKRQIVKSVTEVMAKAQAKTLTQENEQKNAQAMSR